MLPLIENVTMCGILLCEQPTLLSRPCNLCWACFQCGTENRLLFSEYTL